MKNKYIHLVFVLLITIFGLVGMILLNKYSSFTTKNMKTLTNDCLGIAILINVGYGIFNFAKSHEEKDE